MPQTRPATGRAPLDFYFDFSSPYSYFAATRIDALAARHGRDVNWNPLLLGAIFKNTGGAPLTDLPLKGPYSRHDMVRSARFHGIPFRLPDLFPLGTQAAARATLWIRNEYGNAIASAFAQAVFRAYFVDNVNISELPRLLALATEAGAESARLESALAHNDIKEQLKAEVQAAMDRGVFGAPFVVVDGEAFWGFDRFDQLEATLKDGAI